ncbi:MAG: glycosyl hydrolase 108 family protein [Pirellulaceae bacterium]|nr:glycosyl hydrolase 108 family protein [Pirellulaceae bacterium]
MADFEIAYGETEMHEGGYANDPVDRGGETYRGVARHYHPNWSGWRIIDQLKETHPDDFKRRIEDHQGLVDSTKQFYRTKFWDPIRGDEIPDQSLANKVFDTGVNQGVASSIGYLQESLNLLNRNQKNYLDIAVDKQMGPETQKSLQAFLKLESGRPDFLLKLLNLMQAAKYLAIMRRDSTQERFARGWLNRVDLR